MRLEATAGHSPFVDSTNGSFPGVTHVRAPRSLTDRGAIALGIAAWIGAWIARPETLLVGGCGVVVALVVRRPVLLIVAIALVTSGLAARATEGLGIRGGPWHGMVQVLEVTDSPMLGVHATVRAGSHHFDLVPDGSHRSLVVHGEPGDRLWVSGVVSPLEPITQRSRGSHTAGRLRAARIRTGSRPSIPWRIARGVRGVVRRLAGPLPRSDRVLFNGFVLGDTTGQLPTQRADFRASGLTHLLVASGENVAFVLVLFGPLLTRLGMRSRWAFIMVLLIGYAMVTGLEPSVLRAATMAAVATSAAGLGRPVRSWRSLGLAVGVLVVADPFLVHSVSFVLSVGASTGIIALGGPVAQLINAPRWIAQPLGVTIAAQIGVAPMLLGFPGGLPVATLPANLLAVLPTGMIMVLGFPSLCLAATGLPGTRLLVWVPRLLLDAVDGIARFGAALPLGSIGPVAVAVAVAGLGIALWALRTRQIWLRRVAWGVAIAAILTPAFRAPPARFAPGNGVAVVRAGRSTVVVITTRVQPDDLLETLWLARVRSVDALVVPHGDDIDRHLVEVATHRVEVHRVVSPRSLEAIRMPVEVLRAGERVEVGDLAIVVVMTTPVLAVHVESCPQDRFVGCTG